MAAQQNKKFENISDLASYVDKQLDALGKSEPDLLRNHPDIKNDLEEIRGAAKLATVENGQVTLRDFRLQVKGALSNLDRLAESMNRPALKKNTRDAKEGLEQLENDVITTIKALGYQEKKLTVAEIPEFVKTSLDEIKENSPGYSTGRPKVREALNKIQGNADAMVKEGKKVPDKTKEFHQTVQEAIRLVQEINKGAKGSKQAASRRAGEAIIEELKTMDAEVKGAQVSRETQKKDMSKLVDPSQFPTLAVEDGEHQGRHTVGGARTKKDDTPTIAV